jgi:hypothetical protein
MVEPTGAVTQGLRREPGRRFAPQQTKSVIIGMTFSLAAETAASDLGEIVDQNGGLQFD